MITYCLKISGCGEKDFYKEINEHCKSQGGSFIYSQLLPPDMESEFETS